MSIGYGYILIHRLDLEWLEAWRTSVVRNWNHNFYAMLISQGEGGVMETKDLMVYANFALTVALCISIVVLAREETTLKSGIYLNGDAIVANNQQLRQLESDLGKYIENLDGRLDKLTTTDYPLIELYYGPEGLESIWLSEETSPNQVVSSLLYGDLKGNYTLIYKGNTLEIYVRDE